MEHHRSRYVNAAGTLALHADEHFRLVAEIPAIQRLPIGERLLLARRRRVEQVTRYERRREVDADSSCGRRRRQTVCFPGAIALQEAVRRDDIDEVGALLRCSPPGLVNASVSDGLTALHQACIYGSVDMVSILLSEFSANVNSRDDDQWTPLHIVALCGHILVARCLINCGADVLALNSDGNMPYDLCDDELTLDVIESAMAKQGVTQEIINERRGADEQKMLRDLQRLSRKGHDLEFRGQRGETPLHVAACNGYLVVAEFLFRQLVNVDAADNDFWTPAHHAALWKQVAMLDLLVRNGADITATTSDGRTPCDVCSDAAVRDWLLRLQEMHSVTSPSSQHYAHPPIAPTTDVMSQTVEGSHTSLYSSHLSLADKSTLASASKRLECMAEKINSRSRRKDASDEAQLWSSMQSLSDDKDLIDSLSQSARDASSARCVPPAQFRRSTPPSIDDQLQLIADDLRSDGRQPAPTPSLRTTSTSTMTSVTSCRSHGSEGRRRRRDSKAKSANSGCGMDDDNTNWQLKSSAHSAQVMVSHSSGSNSVRSNRKHNTRNLAIRSELMNGQVVKDERARTGRGQTSADVKKQRSTQRQSCNNGLIAHRDDWLTPAASQVQKKKDLVAVDASSVNVKFRNNRARCVLM